MKMLTYEYHPYIDDWLYKVSKGKVHSCREQKQMVSFLKNVLNDENVEINNSKIDEAVRIMEQYFFPLMDFQKFLTAVIVGLYYRDGHLVFNQIFMEAGRGTGKNGYISALAFYLISGSNGIRGYNVDIVANSEDQAMTSFNDIYNVIEDNPRIKRGFDYTKVKIEYIKTRSTVRYRTSNSRTKDGGRPGCVIFDEIHQYENYDNIKVFTGGLGKVKDPRRIYITTDGEIREAVLDDFKERSRRILLGENNHDGFFPFIFKLDSIQEVSKTELWDKAIPRINHDSTLKREVETEYKEMLRNADLKEGFLTKRMNIPYHQEAKEVAAWEDIKATCQSVPELKGKECIGALDYADLRDFCSVGLLFKHKGKRIFLQHTFIHEKSLELTEFNVNINEAVEAGYATIVRGYPMIPANIIVNWFKEKSLIYHIKDKKVVADRYRISSLQEEFVKEGLILDGIPSEEVTHTRLHPLIARLFAEHNLIFEDDKLMRWYCNNVYVETRK